MISTTSVLAQEQADTIERVRDIARRFLDRELTATQIDAWEADHGASRALVAGLGELGLCGLTVPQDYGGAGRHVVALLAVVTEIARRSHSLSGIYWAHTAYVSLNIVHAGTDHQKQWILPQAAAGRMMFAYGLSEPNVGADLAAVECRAERRGDRVVINGAKRWTSGASIADFIYALVRTGPAEARRRNLSFVLIPRQAPGVDISTIETLGDRGTPICDVTFHDVEIPFENVIGGESGWNNAWPLLAGPALEVEKLGMPAMGLGIAEAAVQEAWNYSQERRQFGQRICGFQSVRHALADAQTKLQACRLMIQHAAQLVERELPSAVETAMTKLYVSETVREIVLSCQQILGAYGYAKGYAMERYVRDVLIMPIAGGSSAIQRNNVAALMRLPRE
ncbi:MAG: acyl-CoA dehydrogenase family protein [Gammaproteobacteria bacterium]